MKSRDFACRGLDDPTHYHHDAARDESGNRFGCREVRSTPTTKTSNHQIPITKRCARPSNKHRFQSRINDSGARPRPLPSAQRVVYKTPIRQFTICPSCLELGVTMFGIRGEWHGHQIFNAELETRCIFVQRRSPGKLTEIGWETQECFAWMGWTPVWWTCQMECHSGKSGTNGPLGGD